MKRYTIGIAGLASLATVDLVKKIVDAFPADKEWDRPRLIVDNNCMIPSRVRSILYGENTELVISGMARQIQYLMDGGADRIIVDCNTAHYFLPDVYARVKGSEKKILHLIENMSEYLLKTSEKIEVGLMASEGVLETEIYQRIMCNDSIMISAPGTDKYSDLRKMIEAVKQNKIDGDIIALFNEFVSAFPQKIIVLGCTELPILYNAAVDEGYVFHNTFLDPIDIAIETLKTEYQELPELHDFSELF